MMLQLDRHDLNDSVLRKVVCNGGIDLRHDAHLTFDELGYELEAAGSTSSAGLGLRDLWKNVRSEFRELLCGTAERYDDVRQHASVVATSGAAALVMVISGAIATALSVSAAAIAPAIALLLLALRQLGTAAICSSAYLDKKVE